MKRPRAGMPLHRRPSRTIRLGRQAERFPDRGVNLDRDLLSLVAGKVLIACEPDVGAYLQPAAAVPVLDPGHDELSVAGLPATPASQVMLEQVLGLGPVFARVAQVGCAEVATGAPVRAPR